MKLDALQQEIVQSTSKNIIVSAGAGSGKTRVIVERIKHLLNEGVRPDNIVAITFTNRAADEMKARLYDVLGIGDAFIGTIHSFANKLLKNSNMQFSILTQDREIEIMKSLITQYAKFITTDRYLMYLDFKKLVDLGLKAEEDISDEFNPSELHEIKKLYGRNYLPEDKAEGDDKTGDNEYPVTLRIICKQQNILTFDQLLKVTTNYFKSINGKVEYLLVDELQDIGYLEYNFLKGLNADNNFYVGDDWQSIYAFKGGDVRIFLKIMEDKDWTTYYMTNNYRNCKVILDVASTVIKQADNIIQKQITPIRGELGTVVIDSKYNIEKYLKMINQNTDWKDWFILVRSNRDIVTLSKTLSKVGVPYITFKQGNNTNESLNIQMAMDAVKLITVHTAKGLESKNVILYGNFPIHTQPYLRDSDERKVLYVGITRAQDNLIILN